MNPYTSTVINEPGVMNYKDYKVEDFLLDEAFIAWAKKADGDAFWQAFFQEHPTQKAIATQAKNMVVLAQEQIDQQQKERLKSRILHDLEPEQSNQEEPRSLYRTMAYWPAAAVVLLLVVGLAWFFAVRPSKLFGPATHQVYQDLVKQAEVPLVEVYNAEEQPKLVVLSDQSSVLLQKGSRLSYPKSFDGLARRELYLSGEAFFEVAKNPEKPFFVYANELVTKVLGTSFTVKAYENDKKVVVMVKTGKVTVYANKETRIKTTATANRSTDGVVLTPNQQIYYNRSDAQLLKALIQKPALQDLGSAQFLSFEFDDAPLSKVLQLLEQAYGVDIVYDEELLASCKLTASLADEPLFEKIKLICLSIDAEYEIIDAQIVLSSKGCM
ncbi:FecR family protein [Haliscomenobacter hydrossis]|uniref:Anti-FecI sigma factor, FecR n=1 Tax=Haliscomenobacter hydrossis (strain ATCC 27775 / DSM 1100 / LMG 10767 / O) TaxID=760192 RepID=F4L899_HALH1|nr:FecR family protein [Haliscomenobacter hydrossis]AEE54607.1 anti-FecI sigma factor, FecR [Haliscomenobacter hydrossis DSM 1100]